MLRNNHLFGLNRLLFGVLPWIFLGGLLSTLPAQSLPSSGPDSTTTDSLKRKPKQVKIRTLKVDPNALLEGKNHRKRLEYSLPEVLETDLLGRQPGFVNSLGQIGKPYRRTWMGVEAGLFRPEGVFFNPYTGAEDVYTVDPSQGLTFFDTRTPYVNLYYAQGKEDLSQLKVDISQNVHPLVNVGLLYYRRNSSGVYQEFETSHDNLGFTARVQSPRERYQGFLSGYFQGANDFLNGGVRQGYEFEELFFKSRQPVALQGASLRKFVRAVNYKHMYSILLSQGWERDTSSRSDSARIKTWSSPHTLLVSNGFTLDGFDQEFNDSGVDSSLNQYQFAVYPTLGDSSFFYERFKQSRWRADLGLTYRFTTQPFETGHRVELGWEEIQFEKNLQTTALRKFKTSWDGDVALRTGLFEIQADAKLHNTISNLFNPETFAEVGGSIGLPAEVRDYEVKDAGPIFKEQDSVRIVVSHRPLRISFRSIVHAQNPTLQQAFGQGWPGNEFQSNPNLENVQFQHARVGLNWTGKSKYVRGEDIPASSFGINAFVSRLSSVVFWDEKMVLNQSQADEFLRFMDWRPGLGWAGKNCFWKTHLLINWQIPMQDWIRC